VPQGVRVRVSPPAPPGGRRFETDLPPQKKKLLIYEKLFWFLRFPYNLIYSFICCNSFFSIC
jgi:hypothetical protein